MRAVIDTNVLVSGLMKKGTPPERAVRGLYSGELVALYDQRIMSEYRDVLFRPKLSRIDVHEARGLLSVIEARGEEVDGAPFLCQLPDPDDQPFAEVAFAGRADALITGNIRHFPLSDLLRVVTPRQWLDLQATLPP